MTSNHHAPYDLGYTRATMGGTKRSEAVTWSKPHKANLSSDCRLAVTSRLLRGGGCGGCDGDVRGPRRDGADPGGAAFFQRDHGLLCPPGGRGGRTRREGRRSTGLCTSFWNLKAVHKQ